MIETTRRLIFGNDAMLPYAAVLAVLVGAAIVTLYRVERGMVRRRSGIVLTVLRVVLLVVLLVMLTEPIISMTVTEPRKGALIVMVDNSRSMQIPDRERPGYEKLRIADALGLLPEGEHRSALGTLRERLAALLRDAEIAADHWTGDALYIAEGGIDDPEELKKTFDERLRDAQELRKQLSALLVEVDKAAEHASAPPEEIVAQLRGVRTQIAEVSTVSLDEIIRELGDEDFRRVHAIGRLRGVTQKFTLAVARFAQELPRLDALVVKHDDLLAQTVLRRVPEVVRDIDATTRLDLAARVLTSPAVDLVGRLKDRYNLYPVLFARRHAPFAIHLGEDGVTVDVGPPESPADALYTDLSTNLQQTVMKAEGEEIGGVILLSDGRFNHGEDPLRTARLLGRRAGGVPIYPVIVGSEVSPRDIAVVKISAADVVHEKDALEAKVLIQAAGFRGGAFDLTVAEGDKVVVRKAFRVPKGADRTVVALRFVPTGKGQHHYTVSVPVQEREAFTGNNERVFAVSVLDKKLKVLLVDGGPRWEYRYLKNALLRDKRLDLKYLLLDPLSASREESKRAVAAFPRDRAAMFAYDTILLGDVDPADFSPSDLANLEAFVNDRGGTMIIVAGRSHMPSAYGRTPFAPVLPVVPKEDPEADAKGIGPDGFSLQLTDEARQSVIFRLSPDDAENLETWATLPKMMWFAPVREAKPGAVVWALADVGGAGNAVARRYPVILSHAYGLGRVFYMGVDGTWRWRYKVADKYFHQFWGQVILWATSGKLPAGTERIKLGTDKFEYTDGEDVIVRVRLLSETKTPLADQLVRATLLRRGETDPRKAEFGTTPLEYLAESGGHYEGKFSGVPTGSYVVRLTVPKMAEEAAKVETDVEVKDAPTRELTELSADVGFMEALATQSGGRAFALDQIARLPETLRELKWKLVYTNEVPLWNHWVLLTVFCVVVTVEWVLRKIEGLL